MRRLVNMRLDVELLARVDEVCGPRGRTSFMEQALEKALGGDPSKVARDVSVVPSPASSPASDDVGTHRQVLGEAARSVALERQARLNKAREKR